MLLKKSVFALFAFSAWSFAKLSSFINFISGFSIVWYITNNTKNSITVVSVIWGLYLCTIAIKTINITNNKSGIIFFLLNDFRFLAKGIPQEIKTNVEQVYVQLTAKPVAYPFFVTIGKIKHPKQHIIQTIYDNFFKKS